MQALSLSQPWAWCVVHAGKRVENRSRQGMVTQARALIGQRILLQAAQSYDERGADYIREQGLVVPMRVGLAVGALIGVATIADAAWCPGEGDIEHLLFNPASAQPWPTEQRRWAFGPGCILLEDVRALDKPVKCGGALGFWTPPYELERKALEQLEVTSA